MSCMYGLRLVKPPLVTGDAHLGDCSIVPPSSLTLRGIPCWVQLGSDEAMLHLMKWDSYHGKSMVMANVIRGLSDSLRLGS
jgi:hypothetical protein